MKHIHKRVNKTLGYLNNSKIFTGIMMILLNIGSKFIVVKLSDSQEAYLRNHVAREILIFSICWMGTRDIMVSLFITVTFYILSEYLFNEHSRFCILPQSLRSFHKAIDKNKDGKISQQEIDDAIQMLKKLSNASKEDKMAVEHFK